MYFDETENQEFALLDNGFSYCHKKDLYFFFIIVFFTEPILFHWKLRTNCRIIPSISLLLQLNFPGATMQWKICVAE